MKILGICGSHREESNTNKLVKKIAEASQCEFELVYLSNYDNVLKAGLKTDIIKI